MAHSTASDPVVSRKTFFSGSGSSAGEPLDQPRADLAGEAVVGQQLCGRPARTIASTISWRPCPALVISTPRRPVDPAVAPGVVDLEAFGAVPHDGRLAAHGQRLVAPPASRASESTPAPGCPSRCAESGVSTRGTRRGTILYSLAIDSSIFERAPPSRTGDEFLRFRNIFRRRPHLNWGRWLAVCSC